MIFKSWYRGAFFFLIDGSEVRNQGYNYDLINVPDANKLYRHMHARQRELGLQQGHVNSEAVKGIQDKMLEINEGVVFLIRSLCRINSASLKNLSMWGQRRNLTFREEKYPLSPLVV